MLKTEGLQRKDYKGRITKNQGLQRKNELEFFEISQYLKYYKLKGFTRCRSSPPIVLYKNLL